MAKNTTKTGNRVLDLFEEGKHFTEELLRENEKLRLVIARLRAEQRKLESQYIKVDVPRLKEKVSVLEEEVRHLRVENQSLNDQFKTIEDENREFADRYVQVERQNSDLINLYVASYQLHSTLEYDKVIEIVHEIVINMIGAEVFGIYLVDSEEGRLVQSSQEGMEDLGLEAVPIGEGPIGRVASTGFTYTSDDTAAARAPSPDPLVAFPLRLGETVVGVITIHGLLSQKHGFRAVDHELFELLGGHAATALTGARLYHQSERKRNTLEGFMDLVRRDLSENAQ